MRAQLRQRTSPQQKKRTLSVQNARLLSRSSQQLRAELAARCHDNPALEFNEGALPQPVASGPTLAEHLSGQLLRMPLPERGRGDALLCASLIDEQGYLPRLERLHQLTSLSKSRLSAALRILRGLDPVGVGSHDLADCLLLQLNATAAPDQIKKAARNILRNYFDELGRRRHDLLPQKLLGAALNLISELQPRFANSFAKAASAVEPDLEIVRHLGVWQAFPTDRALPVSVNKQFATNSGSDRRLRKMIREARSLVAGIQFRQATLLAVAQAAVDRQRGFFERGPAALAPLGLRDISAATGLAVSTVSTAIQHKFIAAPGGVFALKYLFQRSTGDHRLRSAASLQEAIKELVAAEDPSSPLTDQNIMKTLSENGTAPARRTIAKHRNLAGILPANLRRKSKHSLCG